jgi:hypothetical protein
MKVSNILNFNNYYLNSQTVLTDITLLIIVSFANKKLYRVNCSQLNIVHTLVSDFYMSHPKGFREKLRSVSSKNKLHH